MRPFLTMLLAIPLLLPAPAAAQPAAGHVDALVEKYIEAFNSGDEERMMAFYKEFGAPSMESAKNEERGGRIYRMLHGRHGNIEAETIDVSPGGNVEVGVLDSNGRRLTLIFLLESAEPYGIEGVSVRAGPGAGSNKLPPIETRGGALPAALESYLTELASRDLFSGTVLVARQDEILFQGAYGLASREYDVPNKLGTRFDVGSITKLFTKVAIAQLAEKGALSLDDTILDHLPDYPDPDHAKKITVQHLLDHTSGLGDIFNDEFSAASKTGFRTPRDFFPLFAGDPLLFEPGKEERYSNAGYVVLGAIIESVAGMPYDRVIEERVFGPAGMEHSGFLARDVTAPDRATGYTSGEHHGTGPDAGLRSNIFLLPPKGCPAGSSVSSARDLWLFDRALRSGKLLGPEWTRWFFNGSLEPSGTDFNDMSFGFAGGGPGVSAVLEVGGSMIVVVLANLDPPIATQLAQRLTEATARASR